MPTHSRATVRTPSFRRSSAAWTVACLAASLLTLPAPALAQAEAAVQVDLPGQSLNQALLQFGQTFDVQVFFLPQTVSGRQAPALRGELTPRQALARLLQGTGIQADWQGQRVSLSAAPATPPTSGAATRLAPVTVVGQRERPDAPLEGFVARRATTATKTDTPLIETPQSISVVTADQIREQNAQSMQEALAYTAGVAGGIVAKSSSFEDTMSIRGFEANPQTGNFYRDGMRYMNNQYNGKQEPYGLERIEVLKGPASILYGAAAPGGVINTVTKRPTAEPVRELRLEVGNHARRQIAADIGGPIDADGQWQYRLVALGRNSDTSLDYGQDDRRYVAPALTWSPNAATSVTLLAHYQKDSSYYPPAVPVTGSLLDNPNGQLPRDRFLGEPNHNRFEVRSRSVSLLAEHAFSDSLSVRHSMRYFESDLNMRYVLLSGDVDRATQRIVARSARGFDDATRIFTTDTHVQKNLTFGNMEHTVLAGVDYARSTYDSDRFRGALPAIDAYDPVYQTGPIAIAPWQQRRTKEEKLGFYLQDQIKFDDRWVVLLGGRYDRMRMESRQLHAPGNDNTVTDNVFTGRAGLVYLADNGFAPYLSYSQSFEQTGGLDRAGRGFDPTEGEQFEIGIRYQPEGSRALMSASLFDLTRTNILTPDPLDTDFLTQTGKVRSRGLEIEAKAEVGRDLDIIAAYTYTDATVRASNIAGEIGERFNTPRHMASAWADWRLARLGLDGWRVGAGVRYVSSRPNRPSSGTRGGPAYTLFDARIGYENGPWSASLNVTNLTDKTFIPSMCYNGLCDYGEPRRVMASVGYRW